MARPRKDGKPSRKDGTAPPPRYSDGPESPRGQKWLELVTEGKSLKVACAEAGLPWTTASRWLAKDEAFAKAYAVAKAGGASMWADKGGTILDETADVIDPTTDAGPYVTIQKARSEYARWRAGVLDRKTYGDKQQIEQDTTMRVVVEYASPDDTDEGK